MNTQLNLFEQDIFKETRVFERANELLSLLNDGLKKKELWHAAMICKVNEYYLFSAVNTDKAVWNVLDLEGNTPKGFEVNWRTFASIVHNLKINPDELITKIRKDSRGDLQCRA